MSKRPVFDVKKRGGSLARAMGSLTNGTPVPAPVAVQGARGARRDGISLKADRRRVGDKRTGVLKREWTKAKPAPAFEAPEWRYRMVLHPDVDIESDAWEDAERRIEAVGMGEHGDAANGTFDIVRKVQSRFADVVYFDTRDEEAALGLAEWPEISSVSPAPRLERKAFRTGKSVTEELWGVQSFYPDNGGVCSASQTFSQASRVDATKGPAVANNGGSVAVIVWDFVPGKASDLVGLAEFEQRAGGEILVFDNGSDAVDDHGTTVASICCGAQGGLASGSNLALLGLTDDIEADLAEIDEAADSLDVPVVVNMSFGLTWEGLNSPGAAAGARESIRYLNDIMAGMMERNTQLTFVAAAGNESVDPCDTLDPVSWDGCSNCMSWPQFGFGVDTPALMIGATEVQPSPDAGRATRQYAPYSNFGTCIDAWEHGGISCGWDISANAYRGTQGTSFASPLFSSLVALGYSRYPGRSNTDIVDLVKGAMETTRLQGVPPGSGGAFAVLPVDFKDGGQPVITTPDWGAGVVPPSEVEPASSGAAPVWVFVVVAVVLLLAVVTAAWMYNRSRKHRRRRVASHPSSFRVD